MSFSEHRWLAHGRTWPERLASVSADRMGSDGSATSDNDGIAAEVELWRRSVDPDDAGLFTDRLQRAGLTASDLPALLALPESGAAAEAQPMQDENCPRWWEVLVGLRSACLQWSAHNCRLPDATSSNTADRAPTSMSSHQPTDPALVADVADEGADLPFSRLLAPMVAHTWQELRAHTPAARALGGSAARDARRALVTSLSGVGGSALVADFSDTRPAGATIMLRVGNVTVTHGSSDARYLAWCDAHLEDGCARLFDRYPVLARVLALTCEQWRTNMGDMLTRVAEDRDALTRVFGVPASHTLTGIEWGLSDPHRGGRTVAVLTFSAPVDAPHTSEPQLKARVVYKPKDLRIEQRYQDVLALVGRWVDDETWNGQRILAISDSYGYAEFQPARPCRDDAELMEFYRNAGRLLAVLHMLGASDGHCENLIACGPKLHLIDAETLFEALRTDDPTDTEDAADSPGTPNPIAESVLRIGMLPTWMVVGTQQQAHDISALGVDSVDLTPRRVPGWRYPNTDDMVWALIETTSSQPTSLPVSAGTGNPLAQHVSDVEGGFAEVYQAAMQPERQVELCATIEAFRGSRRRIVLRATRVYGIVAEQASSATALGHANRRAFALEQLARSSLLAPVGQWSWDVFGAELHDLENLDVPYFDFPLGARHIDTSTGTIAGVMPAGSDGLHDAVQRVRELHEADLEWQRRLIRGSIRARYLRMGSGRSDEVPALRDHAPAASTADELARVVRAIGRAIDSGAVDNGRGERTWLTLSLLPDGERAQLSLVGDGLYDGRLGIAAFQHGSAHSDGAEAAVCADTLAPVRRKALAVSPHVRYRFVRELGIGWTGLGGLLRLRERPEFRDIADAASAELTPGLIARDDFFDLLGGGAGLIGPLARQLRSGHGTDHTATLLLLAARHLADAQLAGGGWPFREATKPLTGLSHGASGMGLALIEAGVALGEEEFIASGVQAFAYERACFDDARGNWPDFRTHARRPDGTPSAMIAWCHGAPGIGLARLQALALIPGHADAPTWRAELEIAMSTTIAAPLGLLDHLCCGNLGRAAVLRIAGLETGRAKWVDAADQLTSVVLERAARDGGYHLPFDDPDATGAPSPGFMNGLAGVGAHVLSSQHGRHLGDILA